MTPGWALVRCANHHPSMFGIRPGFFRKSAAALGTPQVSATPQTLAKRLAIPGLEIHESSFQKLSDGATFAGHFPGAKVDAEIGARFFDGFGPTDKPLLMLSGLEGHPKLLERLVGDLDSRGIQVASGLAAVDVEVMGFDRQVMTLRPDFSLEAVIYAKNAKWPEGAPLKFVGSAPLPAESQIDLATAAIADTARSLSAHEMPRVLRRADVASASGIPESLRQLILSKFHEGGHVMRLREGFLSPVDVAGSELHAIAATLEVPTLQNLERALETAYLRQDVREDVARLFTMIQATPVADLIEARVTAAHRAQPASGDAWVSK